jgi:hypothetical protein
LRPPVDVNHAGAADTDAAAEFAAGQTQLVTKHPEQWLPGISVVTNTFAIDPEFHRLPLLFCLVKS